MDYTTEDYNVTIKTRAIVKITAVVCVTVFACRVAADIAAPYVSYVALKLAEKNGKVSVVPDGSQIE